MRPPSRISASSRVRIRNGLTVTGGRVRLNNNGGIGFDGNQTFAIGTQAYRVEYFCTYSEGDYCLRSVDMDLTLRPVITWIGPTHIPQGSSIAYSTPVEEH